MKTDLCPADLTVMDRCVACGAAVPGDAAWCGQCFAVRSAPEPAAAVPGRLGAPSTSMPAHHRVTRWGKTPTTFGPVGRMLCTIAVLVPLVFMIAGGRADPFIWGGAGAWAPIVVPWVLRDAWKPGQLPA